MTLMVSETGFPHELTISISLEEDTPLKVYVVLGDSETVKLYTSVKESATNELRIVTELPVFTTM